MSAFKGWLGEKFTTIGMWLGLDKNIYQRFHDVIIPASNGTTQIDHLLISKYGIFVIETKNIKGWIFGSKDQSTWTQSLYGKKYSFQNPLLQNYRHIKCLVEHLGIDEALVHSVVFFIGECTFKTAMPQNVIISGLSSYIRGFHEPLMSNEEIEEIVEAITLLKADPALTHRNHMRSLNERHSSKSICPKCGLALVIRTAKKGANIGSSFLGCSGYPRCRYTKKV